jgi:hypothetical protein
MNRKLKLAGAQSISGIFPYADGARRVSIVLHDVEIEPIEKLKTNTAALAWEKWLNSPEGQGCSEGQAHGKWLQNRLWHAFMEGWNIRGEPSITVTNANGEVQKLSLDNRK